MRLTSVMAIVLLLTGCQLFGRHGDESMNTPPNNVMIMLDADQCPLYLRERTNGGDGPVAARCQLGSVVQSDGVCRHAGEDVIWRLAGSAEFQIDGVPADWSCSVQPGNSYKCTIDQDAADGAYPYTVTVGDCELDPRIIIN